MSADSEPFDLAAAQITDRIRESLDELAEFGAIPPDDTQTVLLRGRWRGRDVAVVLGPRSQAGELVFDPAALSWRNK